MKTLTFILGLLLFTGPLTISGQDAATFRTITGRVIDANQKSRLAFVTIGLPGTNVATISNTEGEFSLKIPDSTQVSEVLFSYLGYVTLRMPLSSFKEGRRNVVGMVAGRILLPELVVKQADAEAVMQEVIRRIHLNYSNVPNQMVGFYREMISKNNTYVSLAEAVLDIYKAPYASQKTDMAKIYKGRRSIDRAKLDTIFFKYQGGISTALQLDMAKNYTDILTEDFRDYYHFYYESVTTIDNHPYYVVAFQQKKEVTEPFFRGKFYIDAESYAISRVEFNMNVEDRPEAIGLFLKRKPVGMQVQVTEAKYLIQFRQQGEKWYYQNSRAEVTFKCKWPRRLFSSNYLLQSEMAVTDRADEGVVKFPHRERVSPGDVIVEKVADFEDLDFWENYNIIEPEQSIENAIKRLARKLKRRSE